MLPFLRVWISMLNWKNNRSKMQCQKMALLSKTEGFLLSSKVSAVFNWWITSNRWRDNWRLDDKCEAEKSLCLIQMVLLLENIIIFSFIQCTFIEYLLCVMFWIVVAINKKLSVQKANSLSTLDTYTYSCMHTWLLNNLSCNIYNKER